MVITLGGSTLCDGADRSVNKSAGPSDWHLIGDKAAQTAEHLRADDAEAYDRGNRTSEMTFKVKRQCSSESAAEAWATLHSVTVARSGTAAIICGGTTINMLYAQLEHIDCSYVGATVFVDYRIRGGRLQQA